MAVDSGSFWQKIGLAKKEAEPVKVKDDLDAVISFLKEINVTDLIRKLERMKELVREEEIIADNLKKDNLTKQIKQFDEILLAYDFLVNDTDINEVRLKKIAAELLRKAKEKQLPDLISERKKSHHWRS